LRQLATDENRADRQKGDVEMRPPRQAKLICVLALSMGVLAGTGATTATANPPPGTKVTICHHTQGKGGSHWITITVAASAVSAHIRNHEDTLGPCPTVPKASANADAASNPSAHAKADSPTKNKPASQPSAGKPTPKSQDAGDDKPTPTPTTTPPSDPGSAGSGSGNANGNSNGSDNANGNSNGNGNGHQ
jgi:hypothetical protein